MELPILLLSLLIWSLIIFGAGLIVFWIVEVIFLKKGSEKGIIYGPEDVKVRIMTVDSSKVVQETVDTLPEELGRPEVIAEKKIEVEGADVHAVSQDFGCKASYKGRALEWANRNLETDREYVLYLDEDSRMKEFHGLPDKDIIQLREMPQYTGSLTGYIADVFRMGVQIEQVGFPNLRIPLYAWGGGIAVRREMEEKVTWNRESLVEDTAFAWNAALDENATFGLIDVFCENQAPGSIEALLRQRRRWAGGNHLELTTLPQPYKLLTRIRNYSWGLTPITGVFVPLLLLVVPDPLIGESYLWWLGWILASVIPVWFLMGVIYYPEKTRLQVIGLPVLPFSALLHGIGALWGIVSPPKKFTVTPKKS